MREKATVVPKILWGTAKNDIPIILKQEQKYLEETNWDNWD